MPLDNADGKALYETMGVTMLASQPVFPSRQEAMEEADWNTVYQHLERRLSALRSWRWTWWASWQDLAAFFLPRRYKTFVTPNNFSRGRFLNNNIIDSTGVLAMNQCAAGMWSGLTSPSRPWFEFGPAIEMPNLDEDSRKWLADLRTQVLTVLSKSNFYSTMAQFFQDVTVFGTSPMICYEDKQDVVRFYLPCAGEYFLQVGSRLSVDVLYREFTWTVSQIVEMFTLNACPQEVQKNWEEGNLDYEYIVCHAIEPNFAISARKGRRKVTVVPGAFDYREIYWLRGKRDMRPLSVRGFLQKPFMVGRWWLVSNDAYARSPCMDALGDNKQIQTETVRKAEFMEKGVRPPMLADPELKNEPASIMPGMVTFVNTQNGKAGFKPAFEVQANWLQFMTADIKDVQARIKEALYIPQFMAITQMQGVQPRNELELTKRDLERLQVLGPVIDLFENEVASPVLQRVVDIMMRNRMIKPMPPGLRGTALKITFTSIMRLAQRSSESIAMKDGFQTLGSLSVAAKNAGVPDPLRIVDLDASARHYLYLNNYPQECLFSKDDVQKHDQIRQEEAARAKQQELASQLSKPAVDAAKVLSNTQVGGGSMLNNLLTGQTAPS
jgi:Bacteriophage head to tail connecting protein